MEIGLCDEIRPLRMSDEEQLRELCERHDAVLLEIEWREAMMCFREVWKRMQNAPYVVDPQLNREYTQANRRLFALFEQEWPLGDAFLSMAYAGFKLRLCSGHRAEG